MNFIKIQLNALSYNSLCWYMVKFEDFIVWCFGEELLQDFIVTSKIIKLFLHLDTCFSSHVDASQVPCSMTWHPSSLNCTILNDDERIILHKTRWVFIEKTLHIGQTTYSKVFGLGRLFAQLFPRWEDV